MEFGVIKAKFGQLHYQVKLDNWYEFKRHINQLYKSSVKEPKNSETVQGHPVCQNPNIDEVLVERSIENRRGDSTSA